MKTLYKRRLLKLAKHLVTNRGLDVFNFGQIFRVKGCGTEGCALGELPYCFPTFFKKKEINQDSFWNIKFTRKVMKFFNLKEDNFYIFFQPEVGCERRLPPSSNAKDVSNNIKKFVGKY